MQAMEARMPVTRPNKLLSLWPAYITGSDPTFFGKPNPFNQFPSYSAFCLKCFVVMGWSAWLDLGYFKVLSNPSPIQFMFLKTLSSVPLFRCVPLWSLACPPRQETTPADLSSTEATHQVSQTLLWKSYTIRWSLPYRAATHFHWLTGVCFWCHPCFLLQRFLNVTMTTWLRSTSREALEWTTRKPAPSSSRSASLSTTTSLRPWETSGCRLNPSPPPVLPHLPAAQVLLTPPPTAKAQISLTKSPPADCQQLPAIGLSIKAGRNLIWEDSGVCDFKHFTVCRSACWAMEKKKPALALRGWANRCRCAWDLSGVQKLRPGDAQTNVAWIGMSLFCYISFFCLSIASEILWMVMWAGWKISQIILYISLNVCHFFQCNLNDTFPLYYIYILMHLGSM